MNRHLLRNQRFNLLPRLRRGKKLLLRLDKETLCRFLGRSDVRMIVEINEDNAPDQLLHLVKSFQTVIQAVIIFILLHGFHTILFVGLCSHNHIHVCTSPSKLPTPRHALALKDGA